MRARRSNCEGQFDFLLDSFGRNARGQERLGNNQKGSKHVRYRPLRLGSPEPALAAVDRSQLLATTQNNLATGNKVNSALDNPTSYFTAQALNNRAGDINNLLDSIGNGVQVLQAANTGITSLQSLVANAQSIANQVLQATDRLLDQVQRHGCDHRRDREQPAWSGNQ